jgi:IS5 family transposase
MGSRASAAGPGPWPPSRLDEWAKAGVFERLQALLLDELGEAGRIDLERKVHGDKAYDHRRCRAYLRHRGIRPRIARRMIESSTRLGRHRWTIERTGAWLGGFRRLRIRYERDSGRFYALAMLACAVICFNALQQPPWP